MIFDIDDCFIESDKWVFYEQASEDEPDGNPKAYLDIYKVSSSVVTTVFKGDDIQAFRNLIRRQLSLGKNYVQFRRTIDSSKEEK